MRFNALTPDQKEQRRTAVLLLRFRTTSPTKDSQKYQTYSKIAKAVRLDYNSVQHICKQATTPKQPPSAKRLNWKLDEDHFAYLVSEATLEKQAGLTLQERCEVFEHLFPPKRLCATTLRRIYLKHKITRKAVKQLKSLPATKAQSYRVWRDKLLDEIGKAEQERRKFIYLDEIMFTKKALLTKAYSHRFTNLAVNQDEVFAGYYAVIAAVSEEKGTEHISIYDGPINQDHFKGYLRKLQRLNHKRKLALYMDNLGPHKTKSVQALYKQLNITALFNVPYFPIGNPVEACFSIVKSYFKRKRLEHLVNDLPFEPTRHIFEAFEQVTAKHVANCSRHSRRKLRELNFLT